MTNKTEGVKFLVQDVLATFTEPYSDDIIRDVCFAIEKNSNWHRRYNQLGEELGHGVVNQWIGKYVKDLTGMNSLRQVSLEDGHLITSYTKLS